MKRQTGVWVDAQVWDAYRELCDREKLRLAEPIEEYLRVVVKNGSPLTVLNMMQGLSKARSEGFEDYARVLLNWHKKGQYWVRVTAENEVSVESLLLNALKEIPDEQLRKEIRENLTYEPRRRKKRGKQKKTIEKSSELEESFSPPQEVRTASERINDMKRQVAGREINPEQAHKILEKIHEIREKLRSDEKDRPKKKG
jgi:hypothetical protein